MGKVKNRSYPCFGGLLHADPFHVEDVVADEVTTYCLKEKRFEESMQKRKYRKPRLSYHPDKAKLLFKEVIYLDDKFNGRVAAYCAASCGDWNVILDPASNCECFLWNRISRQKIQLPMLRIKFNDFFKCILTAPPTERHSQVWFFRPGCQNVVCCTVGYKWRYRSYRPRQDDDVFSDVVSCNGKIYAITSRGKLLHKIVSRPEKFYVSFNGSYEEDGIELPGKQHLVDSCGELYLVQRFSVHRLQVFRRDFSVNDWVKVEDLGGRVFFVSSNHSVSLDAEEFGMEKNCIYYTDDNLERLYVFNLEDNSVSTSKHGPNSGAVWLSQEGQMPVLRVADINPDNKPSEEVKDKEIVDIDGENGTLFKLLPLELVEKIGKCVGLGFCYANFRLVCRRWRLAAPPCRWDHDNSESCAMTTKGYPWFINKMSSSDTLSFYDPGENVTYHKRNTRADDEDCVAHFIKDGWVVYSQCEKTVFVCNLFTQNRIELPYTDLDSEYQCGICFSGSPGAPDFVLVSISHDHVEPEVSSTIAYLLPGTSDWYIISVDFVPSRTNPVFLNGKYFFLGRDTTVGMLSSLEEDQPILEIIATTEKLQFPSAVCQQYLVSVSKHPIWAVFVCNSGEWVGVYKYNRSQRKWVQLKNLRGRSLFVSAKATLIVEQTVATMKNKIFFPRFSKTSNKILPYCMETCRFQNNEDSHDKESNFCDVVYKLNGAWFQHKLVPTFQPRM